MVSVPGDDKRLHEQNVLDAPKLAHVQWHSMVNDETSCLKYM